MRRDAVGRRSTSRRTLIATDQASLAEQPPLPVVFDPLHSQSRDLAIRIAEVIADTPAQNTLVMDIHVTSSVADCFVICSGENERQLRAIQQDVMEQLEENGTNPRRIEGTPASGWILLDYGDVVVHIFDVDQRTFYRLEDIWKDAPTLLAIQ